MIGFQQHVPRKRCSYGLYMSLLCLWPQTRTDASTGVAQRDGCTTKWEAPALGSFPMLMFADATGGASDETLWCIMTYHVVSIGPLFWGFYRPIMLPSCFVFVGLHLELRFLPVAKFLLWRNCTTCLSQPRVSPPMIKSTQDHPTTNLGQLTIRWSGSPFVSVNDCKYLLEWIGATICKTSCCWLAAENCGWGIPFAS